MEHTQKRRTGFTIVELLVAMALIVFIMAILSEAFSAGVATFRGLKSIGDMNERLRTVATLLKRDLAADHFEGRKRLSDADFWDNGPPLQGFFRVSQKNPSIPEKNPDINGNPSYRSTDHALHFTVKLRGNERSDFFSASVPVGPPPSPLLSLGNQDRRFQDTAGTYSYPWAEVAYFLKAPGTGGDSANGTPLFALHRRQRLAVPDNAQVAAVGDGAWPQYLEVSTSRQDPPGPMPPPLYFNSPIDLTVPWRRMGMLYQGPAGTFANGVNYPTLEEKSATLRGADVLMTDVVSMNIRLLVDGRRDFVDLSELSTPTSLIDTTPANQNNYTYPNNNTTYRTTTAQVFDTWSQLKDDQTDYSGWAPTEPATPNTAFTIPYYQNTANNGFIRVRAIQIILRVWDVKTELSRQVTIVQAL